MLHKVIIDQYRSFGSKEEISLIPNMKRTQYMSHVYQDALFPALNHCVLVGGNASGKSNWVNALAVVKAFCRGDHYKDSQNDWLCRWYYDNRFCLPIAPDDAPIHILLEFSYKGGYYDYTVTFDGEGVKMECLYKMTASHQRPVIAAMRTRELMTFHPEYGVENAVLEAFHKQFQRHPATSFLAINAQMHLADLDFLNDVQEWFNDKLEVSVQDYSIPAMMDYYCNTPKMLEFTNILLNKIGIGCNVVIKESDPNCWIQQNAGQYDDMQRMFDGGKVPSQLQSYENDHIAIRTLGDRKVVRELSFVSFLEDGSTHSFSAQAISEGTMHLLTVLILLYRAIFTDTTVVADHLDNNLHAATFKDLLKLYLESATKGQLVYTANTAITMNQQEMTRVDEIHLLEKINGITKVINLDRFSKLKIKQLLSLERNYMDGRFGGRPGKVEASDISSLIE